MTDSKAQRRVLELAELVGYIVDFLWDDLSSMLDCSFVSTIWAASTAHHLFRRIRIDPLLITGEGNWHLYRPAYLVLKNCPRVLDNVRVVTLCAFPPDSLRGSRRLAVLPLPLVTHIATMFPLLSTMVIDGISMFCANTPLEMAPLPAPIFGQTRLGGLRITLDFSSQDLQPKMLSAILDSCVGPSGIPLLHLDLTADRTFREGRPAQRVPEPTKLCQVYCLSLRCDGHERAIASFLGEIEAALDTSEMKILWLYDYFPRRDTANSVNVFLEKHGANLGIFGMHVNREIFPRALHWSPMLEEYGRSIMAGLGLRLAHCKNLQRLYAQIRLRRPVDHPHQLPVTEWQNRCIWEPLIHTVLHPSLSVRRVHIRISVRAVGRESEPALLLMLSALNWTLLARAARAMSMLELVRVHLEGGLLPTFEDARKEIEVWLGDAGARKIEVVAGPGDEPFGSHAPAISY